MEKKNTINIDTNDINSKFQFILYAISSIAGIIFALLIFRKVNIRQNPFGSQTEIYGLKVYYMIVLFLLYWLFYKTITILIQNPINQYEVYTRSLIFSKNSELITLLLIFIYSWLFLPDHFFLFICFLTYQLYLYLLNLLQRFKNKQLLAQIVIYVMVSLILSVSHFLIFKTPNFIYVLTVEEFSSTAAYIIITIVLTAILFNETNQRSQRINEIFVGVFFSLILTIFNLILLHDTYYQFGEGEIFAVERYLYKTISLILPLVTSCYFIRFAKSSYSN